MRRPPSGGKGRSPQPVALVTQPAGCPIGVEMSGLTALGVLCAMVCGVEKVPWLS